MRLAEPGWLAALVIVPLPWLLGRLRPTVRWPTLGGFARGPRGWAGGPRRLPGFLRGAAIACLVVALARPQEVGGRTRVAARGVAIVVAIDDSSSMNEVDFAAEGGPIARLEAAKGTIGRFVAGRPDDLIGLVVFARYPDLACPPTLDHDALRAIVEQARPARPGDDGTNLADAIVWALGPLREADPARKVLILVTDGRDTPGIARPLEPPDAAALARELGVVLHTIAIGDPDPDPARTLVEPTTGLGLDLRVRGPDLEGLAMLARVGGGQAFQANDARDLDRAFRAIDALETSPVRGTIRTRYRERFAPWVAAALALLVGDRLLSGGRLRRLP